MNKIDFSILFEVEKANPNGDPLNGNLPRQNQDFLGEVSDVALKRKIRNRLLELRGPIFMQNNNTPVTEKTFIKNRFLKTIGIERDAKKNKLSPFQLAKNNANILLEQYIDVRLFGQVITLESPVSIKGALTVTHATTISPIQITTTQITKSIPFEKESNSDTMGYKHRVEYGLYRFNMTLNGFMAEKNKISEKDILALKRALSTLFEGDESSSRPSGSIRLADIFMWEHSSKDGEASSYRVFNTLRIKEKTSFPKSVDDYEIDLCYEGYNGPKAEKIEIF